MGEQGGQTGLVSVEEEEGRFSLLCVECLFLLGNQPYVLIGHLELVSQVGVESAHVHHHLPDMGGLVETHGAVFVSSLETRAHLECLVGLEESVHPVQHGGLVEGRCLDLADATEEE